MHLFHAAMTMMTISTTLTLLVRGRKTSQSGSYIDWPFKTTYATFKSDGTYYGSGYFGNGSGTWSIKGNTVNTYVGGELYASYEIISVTSTTSELKMSMDGESIWIKCKKE